MTDDEPKSAIELAMERLRRQDAEQGLVEQPLTDDQKQRIEEARRACRAKLAQFEIMHRSKLSGTYDPEERATLEGQYRRDVERANEERDRAIEKIRRETQA
ncbi:MAG: hypothetical protein H6Q07_2275 [Acidobacteria bacterium]|jgi:hypothetical protein|nr:hypothetical protein [Acidobacteriota bacterium]MBP1624255.1 hypothetical protein [Acidobacteriota bacterium]